MTKSIMPKVEVVVRKGASVVLPPDLRRRVAAAGEDTVTLVPAKGGALYLVLAHWDLRKVVAALKREFPGPIGKRAALLFASEAVVVAVGRDGRIRAPKSRPDKD